MPRRSPLLILCLIVFLDLVGFGILLPLQPFYADYFGASDTQITVLMGSYSVIQFVMAAFWGRLSDRIGRRPVLLVSQASSVLSYLIMAMARNFGTLFTARIVTGMAAANIAAAMAYVADVTEPKDRAKGMGMVGACIGLGFVFGPAIGALGALAGRKIGGDGSAAVFVVPSLMAAAMSTLAMIGVLFRLPESLDSDKRRHPEKREGMLAALKRESGTPQVAPTLAILLLMTVAFALMELTIALLLRDQFGFSTAGTGGILGLLGIAGVVTQGGLVRRLAPKMGEPRLIRAGAVILGVALAIVSYPHSLGLFLVVASAMAVGAGLMQPSLSSHLSRICDPKGYGGSLGLGQGMSSLGRALPFWLAGYLYESASCHAPYWTAAALVGVCFLLAMGLRKQGEGGG